MKSVNLMSEAAKAGAGVSQAPQWYRNTFIHLRFFGSDRRLLLFLSFAISDGSYILEN